MSASVPDHLKPAAAAIAALNLAVEPAQMREVKRTLLSVVMECLKTPAGGTSVPADADGCGKRAVAYVRAVELYYNLTSPTYPVDAWLVATNEYLRPVIWDDFEAATDALHLWTENGSFADPVAVALAAAHPARITGIAEAGPRASSTSFIPLRDFAEKHCGRFHWPADEFPLGALRLEDDTLLIRQGRQWTRVGTVAPPATYEPLVSIAPPPPLTAASQPREVTSALKGARGEAYVLDILRAGPYAVKDVSHRARSADMVVESPSGKILVDAKDYTIAVPDKEVQKFRRDLAARGAAAGVLISLSTGIVGMRGTITVALEALPTEGRIIPVVYAASGHADVIRASVDFAAHLAKVHPGTVAAAELHPRDAMEAYLRGLEDLADLYEDARAELGRLASSSAAGFGGSLERLGGALCDHRRFISEQRSAIETIEDSARRSDDPALWSQIAERYNLPEEQEPVLKNILKVLSERDALGDIREEAHWRFLKTKAVHLASDASFGFLKTRIDFCRQLAHVDGARVAALISRHPKKVRVADEVLALEICDATAIDAIALARL